MSDVRGQSTDKHRALLTSDICHLKRKTPGARPGATGRTRGRTTGLPVTSGHLEILRRCLAAIGHELVLDGLTFVKRAETSALDRRDMDEDVLFSARGPNEPVAFSGIEPFDGAL